MHRYFCLVLFVLNTALASPLTKRETNSIKVVDLGVKVESLNQGVQDDIMGSTPGQRSALNFPEYMWDLPVAYVLDESLELNAKGVILKALDQFRLKSCIDFKVHEYEDYFISVQKFPGCWSYVGRHFQYGQNLSIGTYCDHKAIAEHEFLHALGFFHEQSRYDRDEYVTINFENIIEGAEINFEIVGEEYTTTYGITYDYRSVMHYGDNDFSNGNGTTIDTKDPAYQDVIGQRLEMSPSDVKELNLHYNCSSTISFLMHCSFSMSMCGMFSCSEGFSIWEAVTYANGGPDSDHTNLPSYSDNQDLVESSFMYASTVFSEEGDSAWLETERMTPGRPCPVQCLQFYYFHSGNESDQLNIWIREFEDEHDFEGHSYMVRQITGQRTTHWKYHHVSLSATKTFQVEFEARKGAGSSYGGFSIDDINMSELECPHVAIQIDDFETVVETSDYDTTIYSPKQYTSDGYAFRVAVKPNTIEIYNTSYYGLLIQLVEGKNDDELQWPLLNRQVIFEALDQNPNIQLQMTKQITFTTDASHLISNDITAWDNPSIYGFEVEGENMKVGPLYGFVYFGSLAELQQRDFIKGGSVVFLFSFQDITPLITGSSLPCPPPSPVPTSCPGSRPPCVRTTTAPPTTAGCVFGVAPGLVSSSFLIIFSMLLLSFHCIE